ncbi:hypothetical protein BKA64DRAFT_671011 [Cadophora sp. MPI-SDFR-AT-0126]|nr:hypothetical protein BKA64DRAFT_671011 [Leotiomycetes sp. MPI-SDFR-AT-0126]
MYLTSLWHYCFFCLPGWSAQLRLDMHPSLPGRSVPSHSIPSQSHPFPQAVHPRNTGQAQDSAGERRQSTHATHYLAEPRTSRPPHPYRSAFFHS